MEVGIQKKNKWIRDLRVGFFNKCLLVENIETILAKRFLERNLSEGPAENSDIWLGRIITYVL